MQAVALEASATPQAAPMNSRRFSMEPPLEGLQFLDTSHSPHEVGQVKVSHGVRPFCAQGGGSFPSRSLFEGTGTSRVFAPTITAANTLET